MIEGERTPRFNRAAAICFGLAAAGLPVVAYLLWKGPPPMTLFGYPFVVMAFPTTTIGVSGGIGAMYGRWKLGIVLGVALDFFLLQWGIILSIGGAI
jgi:hypothetical protein